MNSLMFFGGSPWQGPFGAWSLLFVPLMLWSLVWKGLALWKAARQGSPGWFVALLVINTVGILEIVYLFVLSKPTGLDTGRGRAPSARS